MRALLTCFLVFTVAVGARARAQDAPAGERVFLAEIVPALEGTELGATDLGPAPPPGASRTIRRAEIVAAIEQRGRSARGLALPRESRIARRAVHLDADEIAARARTTIEASLAPCDVATIAVASGATVGEGALEIAASGPARPHDGAALVGLSLHTPGATTRLSVRVELRCPAPVVASGAEVTVIVRVGRVRALSPGIARQSGRVGDEVRVRVARTGALVVGRVLDARTVEVSP